MLQNGMMAKPGASSPKKIWQRIESLSYKYMCTTFVVMYIVRKMLELNVAATLTNSKLCIKDELEL